ncbi:MAG: excinuclease ABC subunit UvrA, partial [Candidatus Thorarchaeota archaeon]
LDRYFEHTIEVVVDRLRVVEKERERIAEGIETALNMSERVVTLVTSEQELTLSEQFACVDCGISLPEMEPRIFSWNTPQGACSNCTGIGVIRDFDPELFIEDENLTLAEGAIKVDHWKVKRKSFKRVAEFYGFTPDTKWKDLTEDQKHILLYGSGDKKFTFTWEGDNADYQVTYTGKYRRPFEGFVQRAKRSYRQSKSEYTRKKNEAMMRATTCPVCKGGRLQPVSQAVTLGEKSITEVDHMSIKQLRRYVDSLDIDPRFEPVARPILREIEGRIGFLEEVGLEYLSLDRTAPTLAGGEAQRIRLASQIGSNLVGVTYVCDEPSIGLHARDNTRLLNSLMKLRDLGNTVLVVEHDEETMKHADYIVDLGPGAGSEGGEVVAAGTFDKILKSKKSLTARYLRGDEQIPIPKKRREPNGRFIEIQGARHNNLKSIDVKIPLGLFISVTGVSGSGKSSLIVETLQRELARMFHRAEVRPGEHDAIVGADQLDKVIVIDQSPIGRTPRSNPATYVGIWTPLRELFSSLPESKIRGYRPGRFSFNVKGGRCEKCRGAGVEIIEMQFLPPVQVTCTECKGRRYNRETLQVRFKGKNVADILDMRIDEALTFFEGVPSIRRKLETLHDVGMGYVKLGQPATTLSGGEAQRIKLSKFLSRPATGQTLLMLDEPTTGLHFVDIKKLLEVLHRLVDLGNTVLVIEHQLDVVKTADWVVDLGPEGGEEGGYLVAEGTPEDIVANRESYTGQFLGELLEQESHRKKGRGKK